MTLIRTLSAEDNMNGVELILVMLKVKKLTEQIPVVRDGEKASDYLYPGKRTCCRWQRIPR